MTWITLAVWIGCLTGIHIMHRKHVQYAKSAGYWRAYNDMQMVNEWLAGRVAEGERIAWSEFCQIRAQAAAEYTRLDEGWDGIDRLTYYGIR